MNPSGLDFESAYRRYNRRVYSKCLHMVGNEAEAEDLTQEVFLQLFRKMDSFRGDSAFSTWLYRIAVNVVLMRLRRKSLPLASLDEVIEVREGVFSLEQVLRPAVPGQFQEKGDRSCRSEAKVLQRLRHCGD